MTCRRPPSLLQLFNFVLGPEGGKRDDIEQDTGARIQCRRGDASASASGAPVGLHSTARTAGADCCGPQGGMQGPRWAAVLEAAALSTA